MENMNCENCKNYWAMSSAEGKCFSYNLVTPADDWCPRFKEKHYIPEATKANCK